MAMGTPPGTNSSTRNAAHRGPAFLPWHREFLQQLELAMHEEVPGVAIPFWNWGQDSANPSGSPIWSSDLLGGNGDSNGIVRTGPFAFDSGNPNTWETVDTSGNIAGALRRTFSSSTGNFPTDSDINSVMQRLPYDQSPWNTGSSPSFRNELEGWIGPGLHNAVHVWVGGDMLPATSPNDPVFFFHHCMVDKVWADWQDDWPDQEYVPRFGPITGHNYEDIMFPFSATPEDMDDHRNICMYEGDWFPDHIASLIDLL